MRGRAAGPARGRGTKRVTMTDVARYAGCSQSTVSIVLNNTPGVHIAEQTRQRVFDAVRRLDYRHERNRLRRNRETGQIALIYDQIASSPEPVVSMDGAREQAWRSGYLLSAFQTDNDSDMEPRTVAAALANGVTAIIYATVMTREVRVPDFVRAAGVPVVLLNCFSRDHGNPSVVPAEIEGGRRATDVLTEAGHRRIAHIAGELWMDAARDRLTGYQQALEAAGIAFDPNLVHEGNWQPSAGYQHTHTLMANADPPTAIFCSNDRMSVGCYQALKELGLRIPEDVSVIGYDDEEVARHLAPQLTTLVLPHRAMGQWAVRRALALTRKTHSRYNRVMLECPLVARDSVGPPRPGAGRAPRR